MLQQAFSDMLTKQLDPMNGIMQTLAQTTVQAQGIQLITAQADAMTGIRTQLKQAVADGEPQSVIDGYERLLKKLST